MRVHKSENVGNTFSTRRALYNGREKRGDIEQRGAEFIARDRRGQVIGRYDSVIEAANAIGTLEQGRTSS